jgi:hypothetical protein
MHQQIKKSAIEITLLTLAIAAIWYAFKILTFSSLAESETKFWLKFSEVMLIVSAILLTAGLLGEWPDSASWKKRLLYKASKAAVIVGVLGELLGDGGIFETSSRLTDIQDGLIRAQNDKIITLESDADALAARHVKPSQVSCLSPKLKDFSKPILIRSVHDDEARRYAYQLHTVLEKNLGLKVTADEADDFDKPPAQIPVGLWVVTSAPGAGGLNLVGPAEAHDFFNALQACQFSPREMFVVHFPHSELERGMRPPPEAEQVLHPDTVLVFVGPKPAAVLDAP